MWSARGLTAVEIPGDSSAGGRRRRCDRRRLQRHRGDQPKGASGRLPRRTMLASSVRRRDGGPAPAEHQRRPARGRPRPVRAGAVAGAGTASRCRRGQRGRWCCSLPPGSRKSSGRCRDLRPARRAWSLVRGRRLAARPPPGYSTAGDLAPPPLSTRATAPESTLACPTRGPDCASCSATTPRRAIAADSTPPPSRCACSTAATGLTCPARR